MSRVTYLMALLGLMLLSVRQGISQPVRSRYQTVHGAWIRGDTTRHELALVFTGDAYADGGAHIAYMLDRQEVKASFFLTGNFYRNPEFSPLIRTLRQDGHYLGAHSDRHLLYCDWIRRDSLLVTRDQFRDDLLENYRVMENYGISREDAPLFLPAYEWYNDSISRWTGDLELQLINYTPGTLSHADYTVPGTDAYRGSEEILDSILRYEASSACGLNGFILLMHIGTDPERTDKFYVHLEQLIRDLKSRGYRFLRIDTLLNES